MLKFDFNDILQAGFLVQNLDSVCFRAALFRVQKTISFERIIIKAHYNLLLKAERTNSTFDKERALKVDYDKTMVLMVLIIVFDTI